MGTWYMINRFLRLSPLMLILAVACGSPAPESPTTLDPVDPPTAAAPNTFPDTAPSSASEPDMDHQIVPGVRVGPITADTTYDDLVALFGAEALDNADVNVGEGFVQPGTVVEAGSEYEFSVLWVDESRDRVDQVREFGPGWQLESGIGINTSFAELQDILGPFTLYGFAWDYGGTLILADTTLDEYDGTLVLRVTPQVPAADIPSSVVGDGIFPSDHPDLPGLDLRVDGMIVFLTP